MSQMFGGKSKMSQVHVLSRVVILVCISCFQHSYLFGSVKDFGSVKVFACLAFVWIFILFSKETNITNKFILIGNGGIQFCHIIQFMIGEMS